MQNHEAEKELYAQREATMLELREWIQLKLLVKVFDSWACAAGVGPPPLMTSEDEGAPNVPDIADMQTDSDADSDDDRHQSEADQALEKDDLVTLYPHEQPHSFWKELLETFPAKMEMISPAALIWGHKVCFVTTLEAKEHAHARLWKHGKVLPPHPTIPKPEEEDYNGGQATNQQCYGAPQEDYELPQNDGNKPHHGMCK